MVIIRRVFGPFGFEEEHPGTQAHELRWGFIGIRGDRTTAHWTLIFKVKERKFSVGTSQIGRDMAGRVARQVEKELPKGYLADPVHPDAYLDDRPLETGRVVDLLKKRLSPADFARCTAASIIGK